jgi:hypothetical protein
MYIKYELLFMFHVMLVVCVIIYMHEMVATCHDFMCRFFIGCYYFILGDRSCLSYYVNFNCHRYHFIHVLGFLGDQIFFSIDAFFSKP